MTGTRSTSAGQQPPHTATHHGETKRASDPTAAGSITGITTEIDGFRGGATCSPGRTGTGAPKTVWRPNTHRGTIANERLRGFVRSDPVSQPSSPVSGTS